MLLSSKNSDVGIGASSSENKSSRSISSEPIMLSVHGCIHGDHIATYFIIETLT